MRLQLYGGVGTLLRGRCSRSSSFLLQPSMAASSWKPQDYSSPEVKGFLDAVHKLIVEEALDKGTRLETPVVNFVQPTQLQKILELPVTQEGESHDQLLSLCKRVIQYSVQTGHRRFFNQFYAGRDVYSLAGAWLTEALNTNLHTFEVAPAFVIVENYMIEKLLTYPGWQHGDGTFTPGGSLGNILPMHVARHHMFPQIKTQGITGLPPLVMFTSEQCHYSWITGGHLLGMGTDHVIRVKTDDLGRMCPEDLEKQIEWSINQGYKPYFVAATCGTTVTGAYDPITKISPVCKKYGLWLHIDGAWGGAALLSDKHRHLLDGIQEADSMLWNLHKMLGTQLQCSAVLFKQNSVLRNCNTVQDQASYIYLEDKHYDTSFDVGDKTFQCGRKVDCLKAWLMWKAQGDAGMAAIVDINFDNARYVEKKLSQTPGFRLTQEKFEAPNVCFWYIPPSLRDQPETNDWWQKVSKVAPVIKKRMVEKGTLMIGYQPLACKNQVNFWRIVIMNPQCTHDDMDFVIEEIDRLGRDL